MNKFSDFNIENETEDNFEGEKIKIRKIIDIEIIVYKYKLNDSKIFRDKGTGKCLTLQISFNDEKRIIFTSSKALINAIVQIPEEGFPFSTKIISDNDKYFFT